MIEYHGAMSQVPYLHLILRLKMGIIPTWKNIHSGTDDLSGLGIALWELEPLYRDNVAKYFRDIMNQTREGEYPLPKPGDAAAV